MTAPTTQGAAELLPADGTAETDPRAAYERGLSEYLSMQWGTPTRATGMTSVAGGNARATWRCDLTTSGVSRGVIVRVVAGTELNLADMAVECRVQRAAHDAGYPAPAPLLYEDDPSWLGGPFAVVEEVPGCLTSINGRSLHPAVAERLGREMWSALGSLAALPIEGLDLPEEMRATTEKTCAGEQLEDWAARYRDHEVHPHPVVDAALRWLSATPPPPAQRLTLVHGDYRVGNLLHKESGALRAVVDWEMAHLGDPLEDLAWSLDARQDANFPDKAAGLIPHAVAVETWLAASGLELDRDALHWWQVLAALKGLSIWTIAADQFGRSSPSRMVDGRMGWILAERQQRILVDLLSPHSRRTYYRYDS